MLAVVHEAAQLLQHLLHFRHSSGAVDQLGNAVSCRSTPLSECLCTQALIILCCCACMYVRVRVRECVDGWVSMCVYVFVCVGGGCAGGWVGVGGCHMSVVYLFECAVGGWVARLVSLGGIN